MAAVKTLRQKPLFHRTPETQRLAAKYREKSENNTLYPEISELGHAAKHIGQTDVEVMNAMLLRNLDITKPDPKVWNGFQSEATAAFDNNEALYNIADEIAAWRCEEHAVESRQRLDVTVDLITDPDDFTDSYYDEILAGSAFYQTDDDIGLTRNTRLYMVFDPIPGLSDEFRLVTSYPDTDLSIAPKTQADLTQVLLQTEVYQKASPVQKTFWEYKASLKPEDRPHAFMGKSQNVISIDCPPDNERAACLNIWANGDVKYRVCEPDGKFVNTKLNKQNQDRFKQLLPEHTALALAFSERIRALSGEQPETQMTQPAKTPVSVRRKRDISDLPDIRPSPDTGPDYEPG